MGDYAVMRADLDRDCGEILSLWQRNRATTPAEIRRRYEWQYLGNPLGPGRIWLLCHKRTNRVVGTAGLGMRQICVNGTLRPVGTNIDFVVDRDHRFLMPAVQLQKEIARTAGGNLDLLYGIPNSNAFKIFKRVGYSVAPPRRRFVKVLRLRTYLESAYRVPPVLSSLAPLADAFRRLGSRETWTRQGDCGFECVSDFDGRFDDLWHRISARFCVAIPRTADFLRWRYTACPLHRYHTVGLLNSRRDRLLGYAVMYILADNQARIADFIGEPTADTLGLLLAGLIHACRSRGVASIAFEYQGNDYLASLLQEFGFQRRACDERLVALATGLEVDASRCFAHWCAMRGDECYNGF